MSKGVILGAILGGILMFVWGAVSHMALKLGASAWKQIPNEETVLATMHGVMKEPGLYYFPLPEEMGGEPRTTGPSGLIVYHPEKDEGLTARRLIVELLSNIGCALFAGILLCKASGQLGYLKRVGFVAALGLIAWLSIEASYWNWYGFPRAYSLAQLADQVIGFAIAGLAIAACVRSKTA